MSITLLLGVHAHQPVGNFPEVIDDAHVRCYRPFLQTLYRFPEFRFSAHFSGWLLDYLLQRFPEDMALLQEMAARGQVEMFGSGDCEPVLAAIPNRDRLGQLHALSERIEQHFGERPRGAWLTERVWEGTVVPALSDSGIRYVAVDDYHFLCTGRQAGELDSFYTTEEDGRVLDLFPISEQLRYRLPFSPAAEAVQYLESLADQGQSAAIYFDDIEKFGIWPETYAWVYEKGWLEQFLSGVLASKKILTSTYSDYHAGRPTRGVVYLPTTSYIEMNEWTLPAKAARTFSDLMHREKEAGRGDESKAFIRGGIWRNFMARYPEANWMHKRMLGLSARLAALPQGPHTQDMTDALYRAQANDAYWHGLFGGLYLPHLRRAIWNNLIALESALDGAAPRSPINRGDLDHDGAEEISLHNVHLQIVLRPEGDGALVELDSYALSHNFGDTLRRGEENYYRKITDHHDGEAHGGEGIASPHDRVDFKHDIQAADIVPDTRPRALFQDSYMPKGGTAHPFAPYVLDRIQAPLSTVTLTGGQDGLVVVKKRFRLDGPILEVSWQFPRAASGIFSTEINLAMPSCDGYAGCYELEDGSIPCGFGQTLARNALSRLALKDGVLKGKVVLRTSRPMDFLGSPHFTVSQSEAGFEKVMQAVTLKLSWPVSAGTVSVALEVVPE
jgi:alpha-amylase/alpha-mannosidase (GH57 family)